jgi:hypothetical protein
MGAFFWFVFFRVEENEQLKIKKREQLAKLPF